jgi:DNA-directed RNA polymerase specialized sigma24 family protein
VGPVDQRAIDEALLGRLDWVARVVVRLTRHTCLGRTDVEDVQQEVLLLVRRALRRHGPAPPDPAARARWARLLLKVIADGIRDCRRKARRAAGHYERAAAVEVVLARLADRDPAALRPGGALYRAGSDPVAAAEEKELWARLEQLLAAADDADRWLVAWVRSGRPLAEAAREHGVPYGAAKRRAARFMGGLRHELWAFWN